MFVAGLVRDNETFPPVTHALISTALAQGNRSIEQDDARRNPALRLLPPGRRFTVRKRRLERGCRPRIYHPLHIVDWNRRRHPTDPAGGFSVPASIPPPATGGEAAHSVIDRKRSHARPWPYRITSPCFQGATCTKISVQLRSSQAPCASFGRKAAPLLPRGAVSIRGRPDDRPTEREGPSRHPERGVG